MHIFVTKEGIECVQSSSHQKSTSESVLHITGALGFDFCCCCFVLFVWLFFFLVYENQGYGLCIPLCLPCVALSQVLSQLKWCLNSQVTCSEQLQLEFTLGSYLRLGEEYHPPHTKLILSSVHSAERCEYYDHVDGNSDPKPITQCSETLTRIPASIYLFP